MELLDERLGLPSASSIERIMLCNGSWNLSKGRQLVMTEEERVWAMSGDRIHLWLAHPEFITLTQEEQDVADLCIEQREKLLSDLFPGWVFMEKTIEIEQRLWLRRPDGSHWFSGKGDFMASWGRTAVIVDYKTNRGDVTESANNYQLRCLAVLKAAQMNWQVDSVYVVIIQPLTGKPEACIYNTHELVASFKQIQEALEKADRPDATFNPGKKQCSYCPAKLRCDAMRAAINDFGELPEPDPLAMDSQEISDILDKLKLAEIFAKAVIPEAKKRLKAKPQSIPNYELGEAQESRELTDPLALCSHLITNNLIDQETLIKKCVKVKLGELESCIRGFANLNSRQIRKTMRDLETFFERKPKDRPLVRTSNIRPAPPKDTNGIPAAGDDGLPF